MAAPRIRGPVPPAHLGAAPPRPRPASRGWRALGRPAHHRRHRDLRSAPGWPPSAAGRRRGRLGAAGAGDLALHADPVRRLLQPRPHPHQHRPGRRPGDRLGGAPDRVRHRLARRRAGCCGWTRPRRGLVDPGDADRELRLPRLSALSPRCSASTRSARPSSTTSSSRRRRCSCSRFGTGAAFGTKVGEGFRDRLVAFFTRNPPLYAAIAGAARPRLLRARRPGGHLARHS